MKKDLRKKELIKIAYDIFIAKGYENTSVDEIIAKAGIAKGTYYYHFESKEAMLEEVVGMIIDEGGKNAKMVLNSDLELEEKLVGSILALRANPTEASLQDAVNSPENIVLHKKINDRIINEAVPIISEIVRAAKEKGIFNCDDNIFINLKDLNELRRLGIDKLIQALEYRKIRERKPAKVLKREWEYKDDMQISILVRTEEQLKCALDNHVARIYIPDKKILEKYRDLPNVLYRTNRVKDNNMAYSLITELGSLNRIGKGCGDYFLNVCNHETIDYLGDYLDILTLSVEIEDDEISNIMNYYDNKCNVELIIYGTIELMLLKYCPINLNVNKDVHCHACSDGHKYYLKDRNGKKYRIITDVLNHHTHIMHYKPIDKIDNIKYYYDLGIRNYRLELLDEDYETTEKLINSLKEMRDLGNTLIVVDMR